MSRGVLMFLGISTGFVLLGLYWRITKKAHDAISKSTTTQSHVGGEGDNPSGGDGPGVRLGADIRSRFRARTVDREDVKTDLSREDAGRLVSLLTAVDAERLERVLVTIANAAAFTINQNTLRAAGCLRTLQQLLGTHLKHLLSTGTMTEPTVVKGVMNALNNLVVNEENQAQVQTSVPQLVQLACHEACPPDVQLSALQTLTNLSHDEATSHAPYTPLVQRLYEALDAPETGAGAPALRRQALALLANLSVDAVMVPHLLAAKAPRCLVDLLDGDADERCITSWLTTLANTLATARHRDITYARLPPAHKAASPETLYSAVHGVGRAERLRGRVFVLSTHANGDIRRQAARLYRLLV